MGITLPQGLSWPKEESQTQNLQEPLVDYNDYFSMDAPQAWTGVDPEWSSMVDFSLQDDWDWYFENGGAG